MEPQSINVNNTSNLIYSNKFFNQFYSTFYPNYLNTSQATIKNNLSQPELIIINKNSPYSHVTKFEEVEQYMNLDKKDETLNLFDFLNNMHEYTPLFFIIIFFTIVVLSIIFLPTPSASLFNQKHAIASIKQKINQITYKKNKKIHFYKQKIKQYIFKKK